MIHWYLHNVLQWYNSRKIDALCVARLKVQAAAVNVWGDDARIQARAAEFRGEDHPEHKLKAESERKAAA